MDYYKSMEKLKNHFVEFINKVPSFGKSFICKDDKINNQIIKKKNKKFLYLWNKKGFKFRN